MGKIHGVNLGNWLVLEKWMHPALFEALRRRTKPTCAGCCRGTSWKRG